MSNHFTVSIDLRRTVGTGSLATEFLVPVTMLCVWEDKELRPLDCYVAQDVVAEDGIREFFRGQGLVINDTTDTKDLADKAAELRAYQQECRWLMAA